MRSPSPANPERWPLALLIAGAVCIAFAPIFVRLADPVGPVMVVVWRMGLSIPFVLAAVLYARSVPRLAPGVKAWAWLIVSGVMLAADLALWHVSIHLTTVANSTFLINLAPIFVTIGARFLLGERAGPGFILALLAGLTGAALLVGASISDSPRAFRGDLIAVLAAVFYAGYQLTVKYCRDYFPTMTILAGTATIAALVLLPVSAAMGETMLPATTQGWLAVVGIALVCQALGQGLITWSVAHMRANLVSVVLLIQPVVAAWLAVLLFNETMSWVRILGCGLVLAGILLARRQSTGGPLPE